MEPTIHRLNALEVEVSIYQGDIPERILRAFVHLPRGVKCWKELFESLSAEMVKHVANHEGLTAVDTAMFCTIIPCHVDDLSQYELMDRDGMMSIYTVRFVEDLVTKEGNEDGSI